MARRRRQADGEGLGCLLLIVIVVVVYLFDAYPWLWYVVYALLALLVAWVVYKVVAPIVDAWQRHRAEKEQRRQLEEAQRQERVRAQMLAWREKKNLEEHRRKLLRALAMVAEAKPEWDRRRREERQRREEEKRRREAEQRRAAEEERRRQEEKRRRWEDQRRKLEGEERQREEMQARQREELARIREAADASRREELRKRRIREEEARKEHFKETIRQNAFMNELNQMSGIEFEKFMAKFFRTKGYSEVRMTPGSGDQGVDLVLTAEDRKIVVQLKRQANPVGNKAVHQAHFGMSYYDADEAWVVTTSSFTPKAREAANKVGVALYGGRHLRQWFLEEDDE